MVVDPKDGVVLSQEVHDMMLAGRGCVIVAGEADYGFVVDHV